jgi:hypothetical protein
MDYCRKMTRIPDDSGHRSITGYFYQSLLTSALPIELIEGLHRNPDMDGSEMISVVFPEEHGQDAVALAGAGTTVLVKVVQHKFSAWPNENPIQPSELFEIIEKLAQSASDVERRFSVKPRICLHTNRPLSPHSEAYLDACRNDRPNAALDNTVENVAKDGKILNKGRTLEKNQFYRECLRNLEYDLKQVEDAKATLQRRAFQFGVTQAEVNERMSRIEGEIYGILTRADLRSVKLSDLDRWLTGDHDPRIICSPESAELMRQELSNAGAYLEEFHPLISRERQQDLEKARDSAVVLIAGDGGVGKTALVFQYLNSLIRTPLRRYVSGRHVRGDVAFWAGDLLCKLRNSTDHNLRQSTPASVIDRLEHATETCERPTLVLWLDGIDESDTGLNAMNALQQLMPFLQQEQARTILTGAAPRLRVILTCRREEDYETRYGSEDQFGSGQHAAHVIRLAEFTDDELVRIPDNFLPESVRKRLEAAIQNSPTAAPNALSDNRRGGLKQQDVEPFRHPPLMVALKRVGETVANDCLDQQQDAMRSVSKEYVLWFAHKACRRFRARERRHVFQQLVEIERATQQVAPPYSCQQHWIAPACEYGFSSLEAHDLYNEALSAGLIEEQGVRRWRWRNRYVVLGIQANAVQEEVVS